MTKNQTLGQKVIARKQGSLRFLPRLACWLILILCLNIGHLPAMNSPDDSIWSDDEMQAIQVVLRDAMKANPAKPIVVSRHSLIPSQFDLRYRAEQVVRYRTDEKFYREMQEGPGRTNPDLDGFFDRLERFFKTLQVETMRDLEVRNRDPVPFPKDRIFGYKTVYLPESESSDQQFDRLDRARKIYPTADRFVGFSRAGFNEVRLQILIYSYRYEGCAGEFHLLTKRVAGWEIFQTLQAGIC